MNKHEEARIKRINELKEKFVCLPKDDFWLDYITQSEATEKELEGLKTQLSAYFKHHDNWVACIEDGYPDSLLAEQTNLLKVGNEK